MSVREIALRERPELATDRRRDEWRTQRTALEAGVFALVSRAQRTAADTAELEGLSEQHQELEESLAPRSHQKSKV